ncbi:hypothetical protein BC830DRAFT_1058004 [Chytriomyces sp. MP71]|nr:hypothetical protein BC830DRAFT_1058004 [Chytriomyces sp. MP71]
MKYTVPSTSVRNQLLQTLPIGTVYVDPRNSHKYEIQERKINTTFSKVGVAHFGPKEAITVTSPESIIKMENPMHANINQTMKEKIAQMEQSIVQLRSELTGSSEHQSNQNKRKFPLLEQINN